MIIIGKSLKKLKLASFVNHYNFKFEYNKEKAERRIILKKIIIPIILILIVGVIVAVFVFKPKDSNLTKIKVAEVTHSVFYTLQICCSCLRLF